MTRHHDLGGDSDPVASQIEGRISDRRACRILRASGAE